MAARPRTCATAEGALMASAAICAPSSLGSILDELATAWLRRAHLFGDVIQAGRAPAKPGAASR